MSAEVPGPGAAAQGDGFAELVIELRALLDSACASAAPGDVNREARAQARRLSALLAAHAVDDAVAPAGNRSDLPGEGHPLRPPVVVTAWLPEQVRAQVTFSRAHVGSHNAVHGGLVPMVYDDVLGRLAQRVAPTIARTAYLRVDYRAVTPVNRPLLIQGGVEKLDRRKIYIWGRMSDGDSVLTSAEALFVVARPGAP